MITHLFSPAIQSSSGSDTFTSTFEPDLLSNSIILG